MIEYIIYETVENLGGMVSFKTLDRALKHFASLKKGSRALRRVERGKKILNNIPILFDNRWDGGKLMFIFNSNKNYRHYIKRRHIIKYGIY